MRIRFPRGEVGEILEGAVIEQGAIGWDIFFKGRLSRMWREAQERHYAIHHKDSKTLSGARWQVRLVRGLWRVVDQQWRTRCDALHDNKEGMDAREMESRIKEYYRNPYLYVTDDDIQLFRVSLRDRLQQSRQTQELWLRSVAVAESARRRKEGDAIVGIPDIASFFTRA